MAAVAVVIAVMALVVIFVLGKRKSLFQIAECIGCSKKNDLIGSFYNQVHPLYCNHSDIVIIFLSVLFCRK